MHSRWPASIAQTHHRRPPPRVSCASRHTRCLVSYDTPDTLAPVAQTCPTTVRVCVFARVRFWFLFMCGRGVLETRKKLQRFSAAVLVLFTCGRTWGLLCAQVRPIIAPCVGALEDSFARGGTRGEAEGARRKGRGGRGGAEGAGRKGRGGRGEAEGRALPRGAKQRGPRGALPAQGRHAVLSPPR